MAELSELMADAARLRDRGHGRLISYSRKVFIPLTHLCRDVCHYCTFAERPRAGQPAYLSPDEVLAIARAGEAAGCTEALFTLGDKPELRYRAAREALAALGYATTIDYLTAMCAPGAARDRPAAARQSRRHDARGDRGAARGHRQPGHHAGIDQRAAVREGRRALRLARQASGRAAGDDPAGRRTEGAVHHRHPDRHRRDARGAHRGAAGDPRPARAVRPHPGSHRPELPRQARHQARRRRGARPRRPAVDHRPGAADPRAGHEHPGAAQPVARRLSAPDRRRPQRLGRHLAGHARSRQSRSAVARRSTSWRARAPRPASCWSSGSPVYPAYARAARRLARARGRHAGAPHEPTPRALRATTTGRPATPSRRPRRRSLARERRSRDRAHRRSRDRRRAPRRSRDRAPVRGARRRLSPRHRARPMRCARR